MFVGSPLLDFNFLKTSTYRFKSTSFQTTTIDVLIRSKVLDNSAELNSSVLYL